MTYIRPPLPNKKISRPNRYIFDEGIDHDLLLLFPELEGNIVYSLYNIKCIFVGFAQNTYNSLCHEIDIDDRRSIPERLLIGEEDWLRNLDFLNEHTDNISTLENPINNIRTFCDWILGDDINIEDFLPYMGVSLATQEDIDFDIELKSEWSQSYQPNI